jgi:hypothetical protein
MILRIQNGKVSGTFALCGCQIKCAEIAAFFLRGSEHTARVFNRLL